MLEMSELDHLVLQRIIREVCLLKSMVGGQEIILNEVILGDILGIPHVGIRAYELKTWPVCKGFDYGEALVYLLGNGVAEDAPRKIHANQLPIRLRLLHLICTHNLIPRGGHREEVTFMDVFVIERLLKEKKFNLPYIMLKHMEAAYADLADDPPIIPSPTRVPDPTSSFDTRFTAFEERMTAMHEAQKKFLQGECYFYARGAEAVL
ncbi:hypothetical protein CJ030_MR7G028037 [Morella rubra]|uniref:Uncharacterized protein n=1 Tax=Morella rubra TaxID=262757 RepID=A0A6A1V162_9ROSI|nr:hypothetical protein CJ030_MR7G028037 [Morella rubra]